MILTDIILLLAGLVLIVFGADWLVDGASSIARRAGVSEFVIGLTIVGFGTSCPELVVSLTGAIQGNADVSVGNVIGSNIFNTLLILGLTAVVLPIGITAENRKRDIPITLAVTVVFCLCCKAHSVFGLFRADAINRAEGVVFLLLFALYIYQCFRNDSVQEIEDEQKKEGWKNRILTGIPGCILFVAAGLAGLVFGGKLFVDSAVAVAKYAGVSDKFIAITVLAAGTSLPELATSVVAAVKGRGQLALGNILGSNVFNILLILGISAVITPLSTSNMSFVDMGVLLGSAVLILLCAYTGKKDRIDRWEGIMMLLCFAAYYVYLFKTI